MQLDLPFLYQSVKKEPEQLPLQLEIESPSISEMVEQEPIEQVVIIELF